MAYFLVDMGVSLRVTRGTMCGDAMLKVSVLLSLYNGALVIVVVVVVVDGVGVVVGSGIGVCVLLISLPPTMTDERDLADAVR